MASVPVSRSGCSRNDSVKAAAALPCRTGEIDRRQTSRRDRAATAPIEVGAHFQNRFQDWDRETSVRRAELAAAACSDAGGGRSPERTALWI
jgi:hypothetical protein